MEILVWILVGSLLGWVSYSRFSFNEERGRNVSMILGAVGALIGAKAIAPMFVTMPIGGFSASGVFFAGAAALGALALGNLVYNRWGV